MKEKVERIGETEETDWRRKEGIGEQRTAGVRGDFGEETRADGLQRHQADSLSEGDLLLLRAGGVSKLWRGAEGEQTAGGASEPPIPLQQRTQELLLPAGRTCT